MSTVHIVAGLCGLTALIYAVLATHAARAARTLRLPPAVAWLLPLGAGCLATYFFFMFVDLLIPADVHDQVPRLLDSLYVIRLVSIVSLVPIFRHAILLTGHETASRGWLVRNYGTAALLIGLGASGILAPAAFDVLVALYFVVPVALHLRHLGRFARRGWWRAGSIGVPRHADVVLLAGVLLGFAGLVLVLALTGDAKQFDLLKVGLAAGIGLAAAVPSTMRLLGEMLRGLAVAAIVLVATAGVYFGARATASSAPPGLQPVIDVITIVVLTAVLVPLHAWLRVGIDRVVLRRSRHRRAVLQTFLHTLSPELGGAECARRGLAEIAMVMHLPGAAILLADGPIFAVGQLDAESLRRIWPGGTAADDLPRQAVVGIALHDFPDRVREALIDSGVVVMIPVVSPRRLWGHLLAQTTLLGALWRPEDIEAAVDFTDGLARVIDGAELLERAVAVERSLAHAEKLAVIGELVARIAHEIRNPITGARSLAQQLVAEPNAPFREEHELILGELERVEREVAGLLRFARRDEYRFAPVDLSALACATLDEFRPRLEAAGIAITIDTSSGVVANADRQKIRQVLINLTENAIDALANGRNTKQILVAVDEHHRNARLRFSDSGPGVPEEALPQLFAPFFSLKDKGTGLGLAIVKRTVEAHGGTVTAHPGADGGVTFQVELPLAVNVEQ